MSLLCENRFFRCSCREMPQLEPRSIMQNVDHVRSGDKIGEKNNWNCLIAADACLRNDIAGVSHVAAAETYWK